MEHFLETWGYLALLVATAVSALGIPIGSEIAIGYAGALASGQLVTTGKDHLNIVLVIVLATVGELIGSAAGYSVGYFGGRPLVDKVGRFVLVSKKDLDRAEAWIDGRGESVVFFARLIPLVRSFISLAAGLAEMGRAKFAILTVLGSAVFTGALAGIGYSLGSSWHHVVKDFSYAGYVAIVLVVIAIALALVHRVRQVRSERTAGGAA